MKTSHHPSESWLLDYALGNLPELFEAVIRPHVGVCAQCCDTIAFAERLGGNMLAANPVTRSSLDAMAICDHHEQEETPTDAISRAEHVAVAGDIGQLVATYLNSSLDALPWRRIGKGLRICRLAKHAGTRMWMLRGEPGMMLPEHTHTGSELTLVLKGAYFCGSDIYSAGDIEDADESTVHRPVITRDGECICLAVTEGKLQFQNWLPRLVQPLIGI